MSLPATPSRDSATRAAFAPWPVYEADEVAAVVQALQSGKVNYWTGEEARAFEREYAAAVGVPHAIAVSNGTAALELCLQALDIPAGSEVITSPRTFIASASCVVMRGCIPVLADVDRDSGNITAETIAKVITPRTRAIIPVHLAGWPCDMDPIMALAETHGLQVIEDCAQANGATYRGRPVGSLGHMGAFSFCQDKIITTGGEGGLVTTADPALWERAWSFKDHGKSFDAVYRRTHAPGFRWLHESFGTNFRMTELQAAIGRRQLAKLPDWTGRRRGNMARLNEGFRAMPGLRIAEAPAHLGHAAYKAYVFVKPERLKEGWNRDRIMTTVDGTGVPCFSGSCSELYLEKAFTHAGWGPVKRFPTARELGETSLMFLVHPTLTEADMDRTLAAVAQVMAEASR